MFDGPIGSLLRPFTTRAIAYGSVLAAPDARGSEALAYLLRAYRRRAGRASLFTELRNLSDTDIIQPVLRACGFAYEEHLNFLIDLRRPPEAILRSISPRTRQLIRRGLRSGEVVVEEVSDRNGLSTVYGLLSQTYERVGVPLADRSLFEAAFDALHSKGMARFTLARVGEAPAAVSVELLYRGVVYGWYGGTDRAFSAYQPTELLTWRILEWGAEHGFEVYDFGGAGKPNEKYGVRAFKAKFGGQLVCYGRNTHIHAPRRLRLSDFAYRVYRHLT